MSLLNDISRTVNVIDTRRHALKQLFLVFSIFLIFMGFCWFIFFYLQFSIIYIQRIRISLRGCWHEYRNESIDQHVVEVCIQSYLKLSPPKLSRLMNNRLNLSLLEVMLWLFPPKPKIIYMRPLPPNSWSDAKSLIVWRSKTRSKMITTK